VPAPKLPTVVVLWPGCDIRIFPGQVLNDSQITWFWRHRTISTPEARFACKTNLRETENGSAPHTCTILPQGGPTQARSVLWHYFRPEGMFR